jgi:hypothetical protein
VGRPGGILRGGVDLPLGESCATRLLGHTSRHDGRRCARGLGSLGIQPWVTQDHVLTGMPDVTHTDAILSADTVVEHLAVTRVDPHMVRDRPPVPAPI